MLEEERGAEREVATGGEACVRGGVTKGAARGAGNKGGVVPELGSDGCQPGRHVAVATIKEVPRWKGWQSLWPRDRGGPLQHNTREGEKGRQVEGRRGVKNAGGPCQRAEGAPWRRNKGWHGRE